VAIGLEKELGIRAIDLVRLQAEYDLAIEKSVDMAGMEKASLARM
jgi:hypothetical protein